MTPAEMIQAFYEGRSIHDICKQTMIDAAIAATLQQQPSAEYLRGYAARESISGQHCAKCEDAECPGNVAPQKQPRPIGYDLDDVTIPSRENPAPLHVKKQPRRFTAEEVRELRACVCEHDCGCCGVLKAMIQRSGGQSMSLIENAYLEGVVTALIGLALGAAAVKWIEYAEKLSPPDRW